MIKKTTYSEVQNAVSPYRTFDLQVHLLAELSASSADLALVGPGVCGVHFLYHQIPLAAVGHVLCVDPLVLHPRARADRQRIAIGQLAPRDLQSRKKVFFRSCHCHRANCD